MSGPGISLISGPGHWQSSPRSVIWSSKSSVSNCHNPSSESENNKCNGLPTLTSARHCVSLTCHINVMCHKAMES